jgi:hypothetical protein
MLINRESGFSTFLCQKTLSFLTNSISKFFFKDLLYTILLIKVYKIFQKRVFFFLPKISGLKSDVSINKHIVISSFSILLRQIKKKNYENFGCFHFLLKSPKTILNEIITICLLIETYIKRVLKSLGDNFFF